MNLFKISEISTSMLLLLLVLNMKPINVIVFYDPNENLSWSQFLTQMLSVIIQNKLSYSAMLKKQPIHHRFAFLGPLVLENNLLNFQTLVVDRDQTVSRRSKPSSRTTLNGEQPYPWDLLQPQDVMSRHRGAKHRRRCELLGGISLLSPEYLLSVERWPFHTEPPDH